MKEWRWDRLRVHLQREGWLRPVWGTARPIIVVIIVLLLWMTSGAFSVRTGMMMMATFAVLETLTRRVKMPVWTMKAMVVAALSVMADVALALLLTDRTPTLLPLFPLLQPLIAGAAVIILLPLDAFLKRRVLRHAAMLRSQWTMPVIGIAGSVGKTTTKRMLASILEPDGALATPAHVNTEMGVAQWIERWKSHISHPNDQGRTKNQDPSPKRRVSSLIVEMGAYRKGEIRTLCSVAQPTIGVLTALGRDHVGLFGSVDAIAQANAELLEALPPEGRAIVNGDDEGCRRAASTAHCPVTFVSMADAQDIREENDGTSFILNGTAFHIPVRGAHNVMNALLAIAAAHATGARLADTAQRLRTFRPEAHTFTVRLERGCLLLDDTYNSSPESIRAAIAWAAAQTQSPKVLLTSGIMELGAEETAILRELGTAARGVFARVVFTTDAGRSAFAEGFDGIVERLNAQTECVIAGSLLACVGRMPLSMVSRMLPGDKNPKSALRRAQGDTAIFHFPFSIPRFPIHHTFAPLADRRQRLLALTLSYAPWHYRRGPATDKLRAALEERFRMYTALFSSGREGLLAFLRAAEIGAGDEVIVQGFTCMVVPNAIRAAGAVPVYADIEPGTLNLDVVDVERRITPRTKAILCQHTFGIPADTERLRTLCDRHNILLIEDCAHVLPDDPCSVIGRHGDAMLLSFGRDKAISGVAGGAMLCRDAKLATRIRDSEDHAADLSLTTIIRLLEYPQIYGLALPLYGMGIGKGLLWIAGRLRLLIPILTSDERRGRMDATVHHIPNVCAALALDQFQRLRTINDHRRMLTRLYAQASKDRNWPMLDGITPDLPLQKFPLFVHNADAIRRALKQHNIFLDDGWTGCVICPRTADASGAGYEPGCAPCAEDAARGILSLPTHPGMTATDAHRLVEAIAPFLA